MNVTKKVRGLRLRHAVGCLVLMLLPHAAGTVLGDPRESAVEKYLESLPKDQGVVNARYPIGDLPLYRKDAAGRAIFDASLLLAFVHSAAGHEEWREDTMTIIMLDRATLVVRQSPRNQARIAVALNDFRANHRKLGATAPANDGEP